MLGGCEGGEFTCLGGAGGEGPFDEDGFWAGIGGRGGGVGEQGGEGNGVVRVYTGADDDQVDGGIGGEGSGGLVGLCGGGEVVGEDGLVGFGEGGVAQADDLIVWGAAEVGQVGEDGP